MLCIRNRSIVPAVFALYKRSTLSLDHLGEDDDRAFGVGFDSLRSVEKRCNAVFIGGKDMLAEGNKFGVNVPHRHNFFIRAIQLDAVVIQNSSGIWGFQLGCSHDSSPDNALLDLTAT